MIQKEDLPMARRVACLRMSCTLLAAVEPASLQSLIIFQMRRIRPMKLPLFKEIFTGQLQFEVKPQAIKSYSTPPISLAQASASGTGSPVLGAGEGHRRWVWLCTTG